MVTGEDTAVATAVPLIKEVGGGTFVSLSKTGFEPKTSAWEATSQQFSCEPFLSKIVVVIALQT